MLCLLRTGYVLRPEGPEPILCTSCLLFKTLRRPQDPPMGRSTCGIKLLLFDLSDRLALRHVRAALSQSCREQFRLSSRSDIRF